MTARTLALTLALAASACARSPASRGAMPDGGCRSEAGCPSGDSYSFERMWGSAPDDIWVVGLGGLIMHFDGRAWRRVPSGTTADLRAIAGRGRGDALIVGDGHTILRLRGTTWTAEGPRGGADAGALIQNTNLRDVWMAANGDAWVAGGLQRPRAMSGELVDSCVLGRHEKGAWVFDREDECGPLEAVWGTGPNDVWARAGEFLVQWNGRSLIKYPKKQPPPRRGHHGFAGGWRLSAERLLKHPDRPPPPPSGKNPRFVADFWAFGADDVWAVAPDAFLHFDGRAWTITPLPPR